MSLHELRLLNGLMAFMVPNANTWPSPLAQFAYVHTGLEKPFRVEINGQIGNPTPELVSHSQTLAHIVLLEIKHRTITDKQALGYLAVASIELHGQGFCVPGSSPPENKDVVYLCDSNDADALTADLGRRNLDAPVIAVSNERWSLHSGRFLEQQWNKIFQEGVDVDSDSWPEHFVRFDTESTDNELAVHLVRDVIRLLLRESSFTIDALCKSSVDLWDERGSENQRLLRRKIRQALVTITQEELKPFVRKPHNQDVLERVSRTPWGAATLDKINDLTADFIRRQELGIPYKPGQPPLFGYEDVD